MSTNIQIRISEQEKKEVERIFKSLGLSTTQAIKLFLKQVQLQQGIPFELKLRNFNEGSKEAFKELEAIEHGFVEAETMSFEELKEDHHKL